MSDDLFSQLFNLFNNDDGDVNWQLAEQINNHINKDIQEDRLLSNSDLNYQEIFHIGLIREVLILAILILILK